MERNPAVYIVLNILKLNNFNPTTTFDFFDNKFTTIELVVVDSNGRTDSETHNIAIRAAKPQWREVFAI